MSGQSTETFKKCFLRCKWLVSHSFIISIPDGIGFWVKTNDIIRVIKFTSFVS